MNVVALVGAQYGSEGKGTIAYHVANEYDVHVRTGGPNAGHTFLHHGEKFVMRSVPCGFVNPDATLIIGPGALIDKDLLFKEVEELSIKGYNIPDRLYVDLHATLIHPVWHHQFEGGVDGEAHKRIGSTGEGVGPARMAKIARGTFDEEWSQHEAVIDYAKEFRDRGIKICDTAELVNRLIDSRSSVLLEGTQGSGLSLVHGPYPFVTSTDTNAGQLAVDAGISPSYIDRTILVARTYPIRVAGNSGPLRGETTWEELGFAAERTTVTKKVRRVGMWDDALFNRAVMLNRPCEVALTFADYVWPQIAGKKEYSDLPEEVLSWCENLRLRHWAPVEFIGTGPGEDGQKYEVIQP